MPTSIIVKAQKLAVLQAKTAKLQSQLDNARAGALANLHVEYGFADSNELIKAIRAVAGGRRGRPARKAVAHRKHARITPEMKEKIKASLQAGKTGGAVAAEFGVSVPSVFNIKKAFGLVKSRKAAKTKKAPKTKKRSKVAPKPAKTEEKPAEAK